MVKTLDFNSIKGPTLHLVMPDDGKTEIDVKTPNEGLVEELQQIAPEMQSAVDAGDRADIAVIYGLAARLISCNRQGLHVTVDDLRGKYRMDLEMLIIFYSNYLDFISEITNAKN